LADINNCKKKSKKIAIELKNSKVFTIACQKSDLDRMFTTIQLKRSVIIIISSYIMIFLYH